MTDRIHIDTPLGPLTLEGDDSAVSAVRFGAGPDGPAGDVPSTRAPALADAAAQLDDYFAGRRRSFDVALALDGTPFQREVWAALRAIPYGETTTYTALAAALGRPRAVRAVGAAVGRTPIPVIVPCHRVLGADGSLTGYRGGLDRKRALLELERRTASGASVR
ncbi:MAG TPA: methylated-DNA--[protein]-cysteine S-methyltransferase [Capillimicrobium sp.]|nr:methylated-DNA--[protein]-cysteine S-methyltransferase [Capillimicrobium sp.]